MSLNFTQFRSMGPKRLGHRSFPMQMSEPQSPINYSKIGFFTHFNPICGKYKIREAEGKLYVCKRAKGRDDEFNVVYKI